MRNRGAESTLEATRCALPRRPSRPPAIVILMPGSKDEQPATPVRPRRIKPVRTQSGIAPVAILTKPYPCPGRCVFCPSDVRMPKSYLSMEPGAQRATRNAFDPYAQTWNRLLALHRNGHRLDKIELIVMGGTFSAYPQDYQRWFVKRVFDALNEFDAERGVIAPAPTQRDFLDLDARFDGARDAGRYDSIVTDHLKRHHGDVLAADEHATRDELFAAHQRNETAACRAVGLSFETRPDRIDEAEIRNLRELGGTKVQLGFQSLDDEVLRTNRRGHDVATSVRACALLRRAGFKVQGHIMPNLLGATLENDRASFRQLFEDPGFRPDELKLYPCVLLETSELMRHHANGSWQAYSREDLLELLVDCIAQTPRYCRLSRVIRDIPSHDILEGNKQSNLREDVEALARRRGKSLSDIRIRQIARPLLATDELLQRDSAYPLNAGREHFLEVTTARDELVGFLRLHLPTEEAFFDELTGAALIREVHVYGETAPLREHGADYSQHRGLGRRLMARAEALAHSAGFRRIAVISAIGTREYYRRLGYRDAGLYLVRDLDGVSLP